MFFFARAAWMAQTPADVGHAQYRHSCHFSQVTLLPLSPLPPLCFLLIIFSSPNLFLISCLFLPPPSPRLALPPLLCVLPPPPPPSAFDDLSQAHGGEYSKAGYGGSAQSQAKSAGSGPGKGTYTTHVCTLITHSQWAFSIGEKLLYSQLQMILQTRVFWRKVCICTRVIALSCVHRRWVHAREWG